MVQPEQTEGPYFVDKMLNRQDVRLDPVTKATQAGLPLRLTFNVSQVTGEGKCAPLPGAQVDLWQCDASGVYSGVKDPLFNTVGQHFLRGYQVTDARGTANFVTIYPGWYPAVPSTSISRSAPHLQRRRDTSSFRSCILTKPSPIECSHASPMRHGPVSG